MGAIKDLLITVYGGGNEAVMAAERLSGLLRWVPTGERVPDIGSIVLGWHPEDEVRTWSRHAGNRGRVVWGPTDENAVVSPNEPLCWMPLPEPPDWSPRMGVAEP